jgi:hypothetical protein
MPEPVVVEVTDPVAALPVAPPEPAIVVPLVVLPVALCAVAPPLLAAALSVSEGPSGGSSEPHAVSARAVPSRSISVSE